MAVESCLESLCFEIAGLRKGREHKKTAGKRTNIKEMKKRKQAMGHRDQQRSEAQLAKQYQRDLEHLAALNRLVDPNYEKRQRILLAQQTALSAKQEKARLYLDTMISDALGAPYGGLSAKKKEEYDRRVEELRTAFGSS